MSVDPKTQCPDCGSNEAVDKAVAWDALHDIPEKTKKELKKLWEVASRAQTIVNIRDTHATKLNEDGTSEYVLEFVRKDDLDKLHALLHELNDE